jgi:hypothetical protein
MCPFGSPLSDSAAATLPYGLLARAEWRQAATAASD